MGATLKPPVRAVFQLADLGAGRPDFGLFAAGQFERPADGSSPERRAGALSERGAGEVKGPDESLDRLLAGKQVNKYWDKYRQVLVTNLRQFAFVAEDAAGHPLLLDSFTLAATEAEFWTLCHTPTPPPAALAEGFAAFLARCLRHAAPLDEPKDLAWFLAAFAREARQRLETADPKHLQPLRTALEETLGVRFDGDKGGRFLRATVVQTLFYGVFSAWVLWHRDGGGEDGPPFAWRNAPDYLELPVMQVLFEQMGTTSFLKNVHLRNLLDRTDLVLSRVNSERFFKRFAEAEAIQYFYEPFLEAYDPQLRKELGVWYTPPKLVRYMVARTDWALRHELHIADGLADERVVVLDPCCGTGAFLVEVLHHIGDTLTRQGAGALRGEQLRKAATERLFGFEILTAPFVVAHLQLGLALREAGAALPPNARAAVYLTNALTSWDPAKNEKQFRIALPELLPLGAMHRRPGAADDQLNSAEGHFGLRARWGTRSGGTVLPGAGTTTPTPDAPDLLDIWLNEEACWGRVPAAVWATTLGGYPVLKKWLSYRAAPVLARDLLLSEVQEFARLVRRLAALLALAPALDTAYAASQAPAERTPEANV